MDVIVRNYRNIYEEVRLKSVTVLAMFLAECHRVFDL